MEVTHIEGTYRRTCESVMNVLRRNKDSLMAVLEAFVYDPLLNWRLLDSNTKFKSTEIESVSSSSIQDAELLEPLSIRKSPPPAEFAPSSVQPEALNRKAVVITNRVKDKLTGKDFGPDEVLSVQKQVDLLIRQATSNENLCQCYIGWCPFWWKVTSFLLLTVRVILSRLVCDLFVFIGIKRFSYCVFCLSLWIQKIETFIRMCYVVHVQNFHNNLIGDYKSFNAFQIFSNAIFSKYPALMK